MTDVAGGLRSGCFDLVAANAPWVPTPASAAERSRPYRDGGPTGVELPTRFIEAGAALLRPGGVAITLALDVILEDGRRPLREVCADLDVQGNETAVLPTPVNGRLPELRARICAQHETLVGAEHVAVVVVRPRAFTSREDTLVAAEALARRWRK